MSQSGRYTGLRLSVLALILAIHADQLAQQTIASPEINLDAYHKGYDSRSSSYRVDDWRQGMRDRADDGVDVKTYGDSRENSQNDFNVKQAFASIPMPDSEDNYYNTENIASRSDTSDLLRYFDPPPSISNGPLDNESGGIDAESMQDPEDYDRGYGVKPGSYTPISGDNHYSPNDIGDSRASIGDLPTLNRTGNSQNNRKDGMVPIKPGDETGDSNITHEELVDDYKRELDETGARLTKGEGGEYYYTDEEGNSRSLLNIFGSVARGLSSVGAHTMTALGKAAQWAPVVMSAGEAAAGIASAISADQSNSNGAQQTAMAPISLAGAGPSSPYVQIVYSGSAPGGNLSLGSGSVPDVKGTRNSGGSISACGPEVDKLIFTIRKLRKKLKMLSKKNGTKVNNKDHLGEVRRKVELATKKTRKDYLKLQGDLDIDVPPGPDRIRYTR